MGGGTDGGRYRWGAVPMGGGTDRGRYGWGVVRVGCGTGGGRYGLGGVWVEGGTDVVGPNRPGIPGSGPGSGVAGWIGVIRHFFAD